MLTMEQIQEKLKDRNILKVSKLIGVHFNTLYALANNKEANPKYETLKKISDYLEA